MVTPDQAVEGRRNVFPTLSTAGSPVVDFVSSRLTTLSSLHLADRLAPESFHTGPVHEKEQCLEPEFDRLPVRRSQYGGIVTESPLKTPRTMFRKGG